MKGLYIRMQRYENQKLDLEVSFKCYSLFSNDYLSKVYRKFNFYSETHKTVE